MFRRSLQHASLSHLLLVAAVCVSCAAHLGCNSTTNGASTGYLGYIFGQGFEDEVKYLHLPTTPEFQTACYYQELPPVGGVDWRLTELDPEVHSAAVELIEDQDAWEHYESDTVASKKQTHRVCLERPDQSDFCYSPDATVSRFDAFLWQFWLGPEVALSPQGVALIEALRAAHAECWSKGTPAPGYGGDS